VRDDEGPSREDLERFSDVTRTCPSCKKEIFDDAELCYHCGSAVEGTAQGSGKMPMWVALTGTLVLAAFVLVFVFR
jgi:hypothetical protein